jgi:hypothetical protein
MSLVATADRRRVIITNTAIEVSFSFPLDYGYEDGPFAEKQGLILA